MKQEYKEAHAELYQEEQLELPFEEVGKAEEELYEAMLESMTEVGSQEVTCES